MKSEIYEFILYFQTIFTLIVQAFVVYLVQYKSPQSMREYRFFLNLFTLYDALFTICLGVGLQPDTFPGKFASWCRGLASYFGPQMELNTLGLTMFFGANMIVAQDYCLAYRFSVINKNKNFHKYFMSHYCTAGWLIFSQTISILLGYYVIKICYTPEELIKYFTTQNTEIRAMNPDNKFIIWINLEKSLTYNYMIIMLLLFAFSLIICITMIYLILSTLKQNAAVFSRTTYRLHIQLTILLGFQLMTPLVLVLIPLSAALIAAFMGQFSAQLTGQIGFIVIELYGVTNALFTIAFVGPYRLYTYNHLIHPWLQYIINLKPPKTQFTSAVTVVSSIVDEHPINIRRKSDFQRLVRIQNDVRRASNFR